MRTSIVRASIVRVVVQQSVNVAVQVRIVRIMPCRGVEVVIVVRLEQAASAGAHG